MEEAKGVKTSWHSGILLVLAITLHNTLEGLAMGVASEASAANLLSATLAGAVALALGSGIQISPKAPLFPCHCAERGSPVSRAPGMDSHPALLNRWPALLAPRPSS
jgi:hypothetical protein